MSEELVVPDVTDYVIAARLWKTTPGPGGLRALRSVGVEETWPSHRPIEAECKRQSSFFTFATAAGVSDVQAGHHAPAAGCQCGLWGLASPLRLFDMAVKLAGDAPVFGVIQMWGRVVHGPDGWRGQYARPSAVVTRSGRNRKAESQVSATYGVPVLTDWPELTAPYSTADVPESGVERRPFQPHHAPDPGDMTWTTVGSTTTGFWRKS
jgi:hypothetical protein